MWCSLVLGVDLPKRLGGRNKAHRKKGSTGKETLSILSCFYSRLSPFQAINPPYWQGATLRLADEELSGNIIATDNVLPSLPQPERGLSVEAINSNSNDYRDKIDNYCEEDSVQNHRRKDVLHQFITFNLVICSNELLLEFNYQ